MKKIISLILCATVCFGVLCSCSTSKKTVLTVGQAQVDSEVFAYFFSEVYSELEPPIVQMDFKADEYHDPMLNDSIIKALGIATQEEIDILTEKALKINEILTKFFADAGIILVDYKVEFGKDKDGNIILGDEISPDSCRLWDSETLDMLDKELFRKGKDNEVMEAYVEVYNRIIPDDEKVI